MIASARYANPVNTLIRVTLDDGGWAIIPHDQPVPLWIELDALVTAGALTIEPYSAEG